MKRSVELGVFTAAILTLIYLVVAFFADVTISILTLLLVVAGGTVAGIFVSIASYHFSPGEHIPEGEEDKYIN